MATALAWIVLLVPLVSGIVLTGWPKEPPHRVTRLLGVGSILIAFGRKPGGIQKAFNLPPHYAFTWGHAVGYPLEDMAAGGQIGRAHV